MWQALPDDARAAIGELCQAYGSPVFDYCSSALPAADAEVATCATLLSAYVHAARLTEEEHLRAWLYGLARAHCTAAANASPASTGSWPPISADDTHGLERAQDELLPHALAAMEPAQREVLDLAVRHGLSHVEIAQIFDIGAVDVERLVTSTAHQLQLWLTVVSAAQDGSSCPDLAPIVANWSQLPARRGRTYITRHIRVCATCQAMPIHVTASNLLGQFPLAVPPAIQLSTMAASDRWEQAAPLGGEQARWRADGFPVQSHDLEEVLAADTRLFVQQPSHDSEQYGSTPSGTTGQEFRSWERHRDPHGGSPSERDGAKSDRHGDTHSDGHSDPQDGEEAEFWAQRADESDPEARISLRPLVPLLRVSALIGAAVAAVLAAGAAWATLQPGQHTICWSDRSPAAHAGGGHVRHLSVDAERLHRQRRHPRHPRGPQRRLLRDPVDHWRIRARVRAVARAGRAPRRHPRTAQAVPDRFGAVQRGLAGLRPGAEPAGAGGVPDRSGHRCRAAVPAGVVDPADQLHRQASGHRLRRLRHHDLPGVGGGPAHRRRAGGSRPLRPGMAGGVPGQRADRPGRPG